MNCCELPGYIPSFPQTWRNELSALLCEIVNAKQDVDCQKVKECETLTSFNSFTLNGAVLSISYTDERGVITTRQQSLEDLVQDIYTFNNGLTKFGDLVQLGGPLVQNTNINLSSFNFSLIGEGIQFNNFDSSRDDSLITTPLNFLYTDSQGYLKSASLDYILDSLTETNLVANDSSSINFTTSGINNHTLTGEIILGAGSPFTTTSGLNLSVLNGLRIDSSNLKLGGTIIEDTTLIGSYKFNFVGQSLHLGSDSTTRASNAQLSIIPRATGTDNLLMMRSYTDPYKQFFSVAHNGHVNIGYFNGGAAPGDDFPGLKLYNSVIDGTKHVITFERLNGTFSAGFKAYHVSAINPTPQLFTDIGNVGNNTYFDTGIKLTTQHQNIASGYRGIGIRLGGNFQQVSDSSLGQIVNTSIEFSVIKRDSVNLLLQGNGAFNDTSDNLNIKKLRSLLIAPILDKSDSLSTANISVQNTDIHINTEYGESPGGYTVIGYHYDPIGFGSAGLSLFDEHAVKTERGKVVFGNSSNNAYVQFPIHTVASRNAMSGTISVPIWGNAQKGAQIFVTDATVDPDLHPTAANTMQYWNGTTWVVM